MTTGSILAFLRTLPTHRKAHQIGTLYTAIIVNIGIGLLTSIVSTRILGPASFGDYKFCLNVFQFLATISTIGLFTTGSQLIAQLSDDDAVRKRELIGALVGSAFLLSSAMIIVTALFSFVEPKLFGNNLGMVLLLFSPFAAVFIFQPCIENMLQGDAKIHSLSVFRVIPGIAYVGLMVGLNMLHPLNLELIMAIQLGVGLTVTSVLIYRLRPAFHNLLVNLKYLWIANKSYGLHVYVGVLSGVATQYLSTFMISYLLDNTRVGFFSLAMTTTMPLISISTVVGTTYFKDFAHRNYLPRKVTIVTAAISLVTLVVFVAVIGDLIRILYTAKFLEVAPIASIIAIGSVMHGMGDYFNRFLGAHARGKQLRNGAIAVGIVNVAGYLILIKLMGLQGAALTRLFAGATYLFMMMLYYRQFRKEVSDTDQVQSVNH